MSKKNNIDNNDKQIKGQIDKFFDKKMKFVNRVLARCDKLWEKIIYRSSHIESKYRIYTPLFVNRHLNIKRRYLHEMHMRAILHDIVSHVLSKYENEQTIEQIDVNKLTNYTPLQKEYPSKFALLSRLNRFSNQLIAYCLDILSGAPKSRSIITIRSLLSSLDQNRLLMNDISGYGNSFKYSLKIFFDNDQKPADISDERFDRKLSVPNDQLGCQAFYMIVNNVIRNTAKHAKRKNIDEEVSICIRFLETLRPFHEYRPLDGDVGLKFVTLHSKDFEDCRFYDEVERKFYTVEIYSNVLQENIITLVQKQNERICEPFIDKETLKEREGNKGLGEMACAATYLRGKDVIVTNEEDNRPNDTAPAFIEDFNILNKYDKAVNLKAFGLVPLVFSSEREKNFQLELALKTATTSVRWPNGQFVNVIIVDDAESKSHVCYLTEENGRHSNDGFLGYRFFMLKPEQVLVVRDGNSSITDDKYEEIASHTGVDVVSSEELRTQLEKGIPVNHDILVCDDECLTGKYPAMLPARILSVSDVEDFAEPSEGKTGNSTEGDDKSDDSFVIHCWKKWVEKLNPDIKKYNTTENNSNDVAYFDDHLNSGIECFKTALEKAGYAEALSSSAQQHLPDYEKNCRNAYGDIELSSYFSNIFEAEGIAHYRLLESVNTRILIVDERIQQKSRGIPSLGGNSNVTYHCHWEKSLVDLPDFILSENSREETAKKIINIIDKALENPYYQFVFIHLGLLEGVFSTLYPTDKNKVHLHEKMEEIAAKGKGRIVFESGRGVPDYLPKNARFVQQTSAENALVETKSKYLFTSLLHNSRTVNPTI